MDWKDAITTFITVAATAAVMAAVGHFGVRAPVMQADGSAVLRYSWPMRWFLLAGGLFLAFVAAELWIEQDGESWFVAAFALITMYAARGIWRERLVVDPQRVGGQTAFRGERRIAWRDVVEVRWSSFNHWFVLVDRHGTKLRVHRFVQGHCIVPEMLRRHVPEPVWGDAVTRWERAVGAVTPAG